MTLISHAWIEDFGHFEKNSFTHLLTAAPCLPSPDLATLLPRFGHLCQTTFSSVFLTKLYNHISPDQFLSNLQEGPKIRDWFHCIHELVVEGGSAAKLCVAFYFCYLKAEVLMAVDASIWGSALFVKNPSAGKELIMIKLLCLALRNQKAITYRGKWCT